MERKEEGRGERRRKAREEKGREKGGCREKVEEIKKEGEKVTRRKEGKE